MDEELFEVFASFCSFGDRSGTCEMDGARFAKLCKDTKLINSRCTKTNVDLTFAKVKDKSARRINFAQFMDAVALIGEIIWKDCSPEEAFSKARNRVVSNGNPKLSGTTSTSADHITEKMTDVNLYSGAHRERFNEDGSGRGREGRDYLPKGAGTSTSGAGSGAIHDLSEITRSNLNTAPQRVSPRVSPRAPVEQAPAPRKSPREPRLVSARSVEEEEEMPPAPAGGSDGGAPGEDPLYRRFMEFCLFGDRANTGQMDNAKFSKFAKDMGLLSKSCTKTDVDLIFQRVKLKSERKLQYMQFLNGIMEIGMKKFPNVTPDEAFDRVCLQILDASGPQSSGTHAEKGGVLDKLTDVSGYTSTHKHRFDSDGKGRGIAGRDIGAVGVGHVGAGLTYQGGNVRDLSQICRPGF